MNCSTHNECNFSLENGFCSGVKYHLYKYEYVDYNRSCFHYNLHPYIFSPFLNNIRAVHSKNNNTKSRALEAVVDAKKSVSKWKEYVNKKRKKKKTSKWKKINLLLQVYCYWVFVLCVEEHVNYEEDQIRLR